jgi:hypothetical protein
MLIVIIISASTIAISMSHNIRIIDLVSTNKSIVFVESTQIVQTTFI